MHLAKTNEIIVLGLGNIMCGDDGVGVIAAERLEKENIPGIRAVPAGIDPGAILSTLWQAERLLVLDCILAGGQPGEIYRFIPSDLVQEEEAPLSLHQVSLSYNLAKLGTKGPKEVVILGIEPLELSWGKPMSQAVQNSLPRLMALAQEEIDKWKEKGFSVFS